MSKPEDACKFVAAAGSLSIDDSEEEEEEESKSASKVKKKFNIRNCWIP